MFLWEGHGQLYSKEEDLVPLKVDEFSHVERNYTTREQELATIMHGKET